MDFKRPGFIIEGSQILRTLDYRKRLGTQSSALGSRTIIERSFGARHTSVDIISRCPVS